jgi:heat shock protein HspQ
MQTVAVSASFRLGQVVRHRDLGYRGVVYDVDPAYQGTEDWYHRNAGELAPRRDAPWYYVIVDEEDAETYVPEQNLEADETGEPIWHPEIEDLFLDFHDGVYVPRQMTN